MTVKPCSLIALFFLLTLFCGRSSAEDYNWLFRQTNLPPHTAAPACDGTAGPRAGREGDVPLFTTSVQQRFFFHLEQAFPPGSILASAKMEASTQGEGVILAVSGFGGTLYYESDFPVRVVLATPSTQEAAPLRAPLRVKRAREGTPMQRASEDAEVVVVAGPDCHSRPGAQLLLHDAEEATVYLQGRVLDDNTLELWSAPLHTFSVTSLTGCSAPFGGSCWNLPIPLPDPTTSPAGSTILRLAQGDLVDKDEVTTVSITACATISLGAVSRAEAGGGRDDDLADALGDMDDLPATLVRCVDLNLPTPPPSSITVQDALLRGAREAGPRELILELFLRVDQHVPLFLHASGTLGLLHHGTKGGLNGGASRGPDVAEEESTPSPSLLPLVTFSAAAAVAGAGDGRHVVRVGIRRTWFAVEGTAFAAADLPWEVRLLDASLRDADTLRLLSPPIPSPDGMLVNMTASEASELLRKTTAHPSETTAEGDPAGYVEAVLGGGDHQVTATNAQAERLVVFFGDPCFPRTPVPDALLEVVLPAESPLQVAMAFAYESETALHGLATAVLGHGNGALAALAYFGLLYTPVANQALLEHLQGGSEVPLALVHAVAAPLLGAAATSPFALPYCSDGEGWAWPTPNGPRVWLQHAVPAWLDPLVRTHGARGEGCTPSSVLDFGHGVENDGRSSCASQMPPRFEVASVTPGQCLPYGRDSAVHSQMADETRNEWILRHMFL